MIKDSNGNFIQIGKISNQTAERLNSSNRVSTAAPGNNSRYWLAAVGNSYVRRFENATEAAATDVTSTGLTEGQYIPAGIVIAIGLDKGEVIKVDTAADINIAQF